MTAAAKEEKGGKDAASTTKEDQVPLKEEEEEEEDRAGEEVVVGETRVDDERVDVLAQLFPGRPRTSLGAVLRECRGDLVKALEKCTRSVGRLGYYVPFIQIQILTYIRSGRELLMQQATLAATAATKASAAAPGGGDGAAAAHSAFSAMALASSNNNGGTRAPPLSSLGAHSMMHMQVGCTQLG